MFLLLALLSLFSFNSTSQAHPRYENKMGIRNAYFFIYDGFTALDMAGPQHVFGSLMDVKVSTVSIGKKKVKSDTGLTFIADYSIEEIDLSYPYLIVMPGGSQGTVNFAKNKKNISKLIPIISGSKVALSICTGAVIFAKTGLLDGHEVTSHWAILETLELYGAKVVKKRFTKSGKFYSSAGVSAGIDASLSLAAEMVGEEYAKGIQLAMEYDPAPPFDSGSPDKASIEIVNFLKVFYQGLVKQIISLSSN